MQPYRVRFYKLVTTADRHTVVVLAGGPEEARERVRAGFSGEIELTDAELETENLEKEGDVVEAVFAELEDPESPYAVVAVEEKP